MITGLRCMYIVVVQQFLRVTGIFCGDYPDAPQDLQCPKRYIFKVAYRSTNYVKGASFVFLCFHLLPTTRYLLPIYLVNLTLIQNSNIRQVPVFILIVKAVTDYKLIWNSKTEIFNRNLMLPSFSLVKEDAQL